MAKINTGNWNDVPAYTGGASEKLELGGHHLQILDAEIIQGTARGSGKPYQMIKLSFDTASIDTQPGFFRRKFEDGKQYGRNKWPNAGTGVVSIPFPGETDKRTIGRWNGFIEMINKSNSSPGREFKWDIDTDSLKKRFIGGVFRDEEFITDKNEVATTQKLAWFCSVQEVNEAKIPPTKTVERPPTDSWSSPSAADTSSLPFDL